MEWWYPRKIDSRQNTIKLSSGAKKEQRIILFWIRDPSTPKMQFIFDSPGEKQLKIVVTTNQGNNLQSSPITLNVAPNPEKPVIQKTLSQLDRAVRCCSSSGITISGLLF